MPEACPNVYELQDGSDVEHVGGKAAALARVAKAGYRVPPTVVIDVSAYREFVQAAGLAGVIEDELARKPLGEMRWEEVWDAALRIRNRFRRAESDGHESVDRCWQCVRQQLGLDDNPAPIAVRSSAPVEDGSQRSHAGIFESEAPVEPDAESFGRALIAVWASLWSDRALLYRREFGLDPHDSAMAVVVQRFVGGDDAVSGVAFGRMPDGAPGVVVEAVGGGADSLVSGQADPARYVFDEQGEELREQEPGDHADVLSEAKARRIAALVLELGEVLGGPQDMEWTLVDGGDPVVLQARPLTTTGEKTGEDGRNDDLWDHEDKRPWYLTLTRTFENLRELRQRVEEETIPAMEQAAERERQHSPEDVSALDDDALADVLERRADLHAEHKQAYWRDCIPLAHGVRLLGQLYNDRVAPEDPYEFTALLRGEPLAGVTRNRMLCRIGQALRSDDNERAEKLLNDYEQQWGTMACTAGWCEDSREKLRQMAVQMARGADASEACTNHKEANGPEHDIRARFVAAFSKDEQDFARDVLELARAAHRLRDDDNFALNALAELRDAARNEAASRVGADQPASYRADELVRALRKPDYTPQPTKQESSEASTRTSARTSADVNVDALRGQPAGPGVAEGVVRAVKSADELYDFQEGEVLVCDGLDPSMTFVAPLAAAIVERRGGMLIHGAIIAREYGLACVTGIPDALRRLPTGTRVRVDGYAGTVTVLEAVNAPTD